MTKKIIFSHTIFISFDEKYIFHIKIRLTLIDLNEIFPKKPSELEIFPSVRGSDKKNAESYQSFYDSDIE